MYRQREPTEEKPFDFDHMPTAAAIIIGNEILSGKFSDENGPWLIEQCRKLGVDVIRVVVIPDDVERIAAEVRLAASLADHVFTTGGIGPTHDDTTMAGIATAFGVQLTRHPVLEELIRDRMSDGVNADALRMAVVPEGTELQCCKITSVFCGGKSGEYGAEVVPAAETGQSSMWHRSCLAAGHSPPKRSASGAGCITY